MIFVLEIMKRETVTITKGEGNNIFEFWLENGNCMISYLILQHSQVSPRNTAAHDDYICQVIIKDNRIQIFFTQGWLVLPGHSAITYIFFVLIIKRKKKNVKKKLFLN